MGLALVRLSKRIRLDLRMFIGAMIGSTNAMIGFLMTGIELQQAILQELETQQQTLQMVLSIVEDGDESVTT